MRCFLFQKEDATSIDTLDMAVQRICKTSKDLRHEVHGFSYYSLDRGFFFQDGCLHASSVFGNNLGAFDKFNT